MRTLAVCPDERKLLPDSRGRALLGSQKLASLGERGVAGLLEAAFWFQVIIETEVIVKRSVGRGEFLAARQRSKPRHSPTVPARDPVALNLTAPIELTHEVLSRWPNPEAIVYVTSGFALVSPRHAPTYGAVKAGLHAFADSMRLQLASRGTHVLELLPPMVDTPMNASREGKKMTPEAVADVTLKALDRRRDLALPGEVAMLPLLLRLAPGIAKSIVAKR